MKSDVAKELMKRGAMFTVLSGLVAALAWPATLLSATDWIDSKWTIAVDRSACNLVLKHGVYWKLELRACENAYWDHLLKVYVEADFLF